MKLRQTTTGFALPTVLIASVIMMMVLLAGLTAITSVGSAIRAQFYTRLAKQAAQSGIARAQECLKENNFEAKWTTASPLRPNTANCTGTATACTSATSDCYMVSTGIFRVTYVVHPPVTSGTTQKIRSVGSVNLLRPDGSSYRTIEYAAYGDTGSQLAINNVVFGYSNSGAFFLTIAADGILRGVGNNTFGQLSTGNTTMGLTPRNFILPSGVRAVKAYSHFLSQGTTVAAITNTGRVYMSGQNNSGQLGDGTTTPRNTAVNFAFPAAETAVQVTTYSAATFVRTAQNNIYSAGSCVEGHLGINRMVAAGDPAGCSQSTPSRVLLPTPVAGTTDAAKNTRPKDVIVDGNTAYAIMEGGALYSWGSNTCGQLGIGNFTSQASPVRVGTYGNAGQPKVVSVQADGVTMYVLDDQGNVKVAGCNWQGYLGSDESVVRNSRGNLCLDNPSNGTSLGVRVWLYSCNPAVSNFAQAWTFTQEGFIKNKSANLCLNISGGGSANGTAIIRYTCVNAPNNKWTFDDDGMIRSEAYPNKCIDIEDPGTANGNRLLLWDCTSSQLKQRWVLPPISHLTPLNIPVAGAKVLKIASDQTSMNFILDTNNDGQGDEVWGVGMNNAGQLGNGQVKTINIRPVKFNLTATKPVDIWVSSRGLTTPSLYNNVMVIGANGRIYGSGGNSAGQLGIGNTIDQSTPREMQVIDGATVRAQKVQVGRGTAVIYTTDNRVYTVGDNSSGQLGDGTTVNSSVPKANKYTNVVPLTIY